MDDFPLLPARPSILCIGFATATAANGMWSVVREPLSGIFSGLITLNPTSLNKNPKVTAVSQCAAFLRLNSLFSGSGTIIHPLTSRSRIERGYCALGISHHYGYFSIGGLLQ